MSEAYSEPLDVETARELLAEFETLEGVLRDRDRLVELDAEPVA